MRGGLERWKRGVDSRGVRQAIAYALEGSCDAHLGSGADALKAYGAADGASVQRFIAQDGRLRTDELPAGALRVWVTGHDPVTGEERGRPNLRAEADLLLDGTLNHPKSYSIAALLHPELATAFEALQDLIRDRTILLWQRELNARRGHGGLVRELIARLEVVELQHRRSRALDPHIHRHLWLNIKVRGEDDRWSNIDSRVAMKFHTVVNAEGELAARTDPEWISALARYGYHIGEDGEIAELAGAVAPLSRRSAQIEVNRGRLVAEWQAAHPGLHPTEDVRKQIDRRAWAMARPGKPALVDEAAWSTAVRDELGSLDPGLLESREARSDPVIAVEDLDLDALAAAAVDDADERSRRSNGRFSDFDLRAGALRALSRTGLAVNREILSTIEQQILARAHRSVLALVDDPDAPGHLKRLMATRTMQLKTRLVGRFAALAHPGRSLLPDELPRVPAAVEGSAALDTAQTHAACAIAGTGGLVTVTGPAGAGKTTMLRAAHAAILARRRRMLVVAPTRKAASVAARETGAQASSLHALLFDHGFRWTNDSTAAQEWTRLEVGEHDPVTGVAYVGPQRYPLTSGDRIVVDEAGMMDLQTAAALADVAIASGVSIALIGDPYQALPVGHAGAIAIAVRHADAALELDTAHRFRDATYAALTLQLREPRDDIHALEVAGLLAERGHVHRVGSADEARAVMVDTYVDARAHSHTVALVCATNSEADAINHLIQQHRVEHGELDPKRFVWGRDEQRLHVGEVVQTRRNDPRAGVDNRANWIVERIDSDRICLRSTTDPGERAWVDHGFALEHVHLAYASTVHGVQGETTDISIVGPDVDAAGLYVGLTRGRRQNITITVARTDASARANIASSMLRGVPEVTIADSIRAVHLERQRAARERENPQSVYGAPSASGAGISL
ncbi:AAA family ATPase [Microbacterium insulae]|uniref:AAA family ATPase n=1 Tax=Microbacterium insulae TaxID=483014 RepID=A0ABW3AE65_9MICO